MTDCALAAPKAPATSTSSATTTPTVTRPARRTRPTRRARPTRPAGVPGWARLFGVTIVPLAQDDLDGQQAWVLSAGAGTTHAAVLFFDESEPSGR